MNSPDQASFRNHNLRTRIKRKFTDSGAKKRIKNIDVVKTTPGKSCDKYDIIFERIKNMPNVEANHDNHKISKQPINMV